MCEIKIELRGFDCGLAGDCLSVRYVFLSRSGIENLLDNHLLREQIFGSLPVRVVQLLLRESLF
jgi:hypothetical protein